MKAACFIVWAASGAAVAAAHPSIVGVHCLEGIDEPNTGCIDGESYNVGLVDVTDRPYPELVEAMRTTHWPLLDLRAGRESAVANRTQAREPDRRP